MAWTGDIKDIKAHIATIGQNSKLEFLDLNIISWYGKASKFDIRYWDSENKTSSKSGSLTLTLEQIKELKKILNEMDLDDDDGMLMSFGTTLNSSDELASVRSKKQMESMLETDARPW